MNQDMIATDPFELFREILETAIAAGIPEPTAMCLSTVGSKGRPSSRMVLLKGVDERGFVFYTNLASRKGRELAENPSASLCFFWQAIGKQIRVEGIAERVDDAEADLYFATRSRGSQLGAWISRQSEQLSDRSELMERVREIEGRFEGVDVERPDFWSGFRIVPDRIEFWTAGEFRLHERIVFVRSGDAWESSLLYP